MKCFQIWFVSLILGAVVGCTGAQYVPGQAAENVVPVRSSPLFDCVRVHFSPETDAVAIDVFTEALISRRIAQHVLHVNDEKSGEGPLLEVDLKLTLDHHPTAKTIKNYFLGLTLFLLEPILWYDISYSVSGSLTLKETTKTMGPFLATADAATKARWLSLDKLAKLHANAQRDTLSRASDELLRQLQQRVRRL